MPSYLKSDSKNVIGMQMTDNHVKLNTV